GTSSTSAHATLKRSAPRGTSSIPSKSTTKSIGGATMRKGFRVLLIFGLPLITALSLWAWEVRGQSAQGNRSNWECRKFVFGIENEPSRNSVKDIEAFVQAGQVQLVSSGVCGPGAPINPSKVVVCINP